MLATDEIIVLSGKKYIQGKKIVHALSKKNGKAAFVVYPSVAAHGGLSFLSPLSYIEVTYSDNGKGLPLIKEYSWMLLPKKSQTDVRRQCIAIFLSEIIENAIVHPLREENVFQFVVAYIKKIESENTISNIPIDFLIELSNLLGISYISNENQHYNTQPNVRTRHGRQEFLHVLCNYYNEQIEYFRLPKSLSVVEQIFDE